VKLLLSNKFKRDFKINYDFITFNNNIRSKEFIHPSDEMDETTINKLNLTMMKIYPIKESRSRVRRAKLDEKNE
jgi:hypothetical protein